MIAYYYICDICGKKLETKTEQTPFGEVEVVVGTGKTKEWDTSKLFSHLCKECALEIDNKLLRTKYEMIATK